MFKAFFEKRAIRAMHEEAQNFLRSLQGADIEVLDLVAASQMHWASFYYDRGKRVYEMEEWIRGEMFFPLEINRAIQSLQKQGTKSAVPGLMVWLHSSRALLYPEQRLDGRLIWLELKKASQSAEMLAFDFCRSTNTPPTQLDRTVVPLGLEPLTR